MKWAALLLCAALSAQIHRIDSIEQARWALMEADASTLVVFDVDLVLIQPADPAFQPATRRKHAHLIGELISPLTPAQRYMAKSLAVYGSGAELMEARTPDEIRELQERGVPVIALTAALSGTCRGYEDLQADRHQQLSDLGIVFSSPLENFTIENLRGWDDRPPVHSRGIIYTNGKQAPKGEVLEAFLTTAKFLPRRVIFFDDRYYNHESMERSLTWMGISFTGFHYRRVDKLRAPTIQPSDLRTKWQQLIQHAIRTDDHCRRTT